MPIAHADAFPIATALEYQATLVTGDPEIRSLVGKYDLGDERFPRALQPVEQLAVERTGMAFD